MALHWALFLALLCIAVSYSTAQSKPSTQTNAYTLYFNCSKQDIDIANTMCTAFH